MRLPQDKIGKTKVYLHMSQAGVLFLAWILTIALLTRPGNTDGRVAWYFALCFLTVPILIYLAMVPLWSRAQKFANVHAFATVDGLAVVLWLSAWAAVAAYVDDGKGKAGKAGASGCDNFKFGSPGRCQLSEAIIVFGVLEMLLFCASCFFSLRAVMIFQRTGMMPAHGLADGPTAYDVKPTDLSTQTREAFSSSMRDEGEAEVDDEEQHSHGSQAHGYHKGGYDDEYALIRQHDHDVDYAHMSVTEPQSPLDHNGLHARGDYDTSYDRTYAQAPPSQYQPTR